MSCRDIKTPHSPSMRNIPKAHLRKTKTGEANSASDINVIRYANGKDISIAELSVPKFGEGRQSNAEESSVIPYFYVRPSTGQSFGFANTTVIWNNVMQDNTGWFSTSTNGYTPLRGGLYVFHVSMGLELSAEFNLSFRVNNSEIIKTINEGVGGQVSAVTEMNGSTDFINVKVRRTSGGVSDLVAQLTNFIGYKIK